MNVEGALEPSSTHPEQAQGDSDTLGRQAQLGISDSPYLTVSEAARFCRFDATADDPEHAFRQWAGRHGVPMRRRGRFLLIDRRVLEMILARA